MKLNKTKNKNKYKFIIQNESTLKEEFYLRLSLYNTYILIFGSIILFTVLGILLVSYTPIRNILPNSDYQVKSKLVESAIIIDSLETKISSNEKQYNRIIQILNGNDSLLHNNQQSLEVGTIDSSIENKEINYIKSTEDSILRDIVESEERFNVTHGNINDSDDLFNLYLYPPINDGTIIASYQDYSLQYYGVDILAQQDKHVMATTDGTIISSGWSIESGYYIIMQHGNNLSSTYKNNSKLLKKTGDIVHRGEAIAIVGNIGENNSGYYLHFELWHDGEALDPQDFISF